MSRAATSADASTPIGQSAWRTWSAGCRTALERRRQRLALAELDDHLLRDIGLSREQARRESAQPFWR